MPDNNKNEFDLGSDFNFDAISEFESDGKGAQPADTGAPEFEEFETAVSEPDFASFGGEPQFEDSTAEVDFGSQEFEPASDFAGGGDFDFGMPPSPQSVEMESLSGNPDEEFGDFTGTGNFGGDDDFANDSDATVDPYAEDDGAPAKGYAAGSSVDPFADDEPDAAQPEDTASEQTARDHTKAGIKHYAGIAAVVAVVGYIGYSQVLPMFVSTDGGQAVVDATPAIPSGTLPVDLPQVETQPVEQTAGLPQLPAVGQSVADPVDGTASAVLPPIELPGASETAEKPAPIDTTAVADATPSINLPVAVTPAEQTPIKAETPAAVDPLDEMVGGKDRGGLDSMKEPTVEAAPVMEAAPVANADIAALASRLDDVVKRIETIEKKVASFGASFEGNAKIETPVAEAKPSVALPAVADVGVSAPLKPPIIENVVLRGVSRGIAWIATGKGVVEVKVGDNVEDAGVVESFQNYRGRWIAVTDKGIILPR